MQATTPGHNRTGAALSPDEIMLMSGAVEDLSPPVPISTAKIEAERVRQIIEAESVGSIPPPASVLKGSLKKGIAAVNGVSPSMLLNKMGERLAFERTGTRLYDALIGKYRAVSEVTGDSLPAADLRNQETPLETLLRIRAEEHSHFLMLSEAITQLGGDPTAQTPCADVTGTATMGVMQVVTDPRTTLAQSLDAMLIAELTDTASWELLSELADMAGQQDLAEQFNEALEAEQGHLLVVQTWLRALTLDQTGTQAV
jgi:rubrerythrin